MDGISKIALAGLNRAAEKINQNVSRIASGQDVSDPEPYIEIKRAENDFKANVKVIKADDEMTKAVLDLMA
jgi:flagellar hook-associated protein FlgK